MEEISDSGQRKGYKVYSGQITVNETPVVIRSSAKSRISMIIQNLGAGVLYIGGEGVTSSDGIKIASGGDITIDGGINSAIYGNSVGSCDVRFLEEKI